MQNVNRRNDDYIHGARVQDRNTIISLNVN